MKLLLIATTLLISLGAQAHLGTTETSAKDKCSYDSMLAGGDDTPWPWGHEGRFPWLSIQGVWVPMDGDCNSLFVFKTQSVEGQNRVVQIVQYDPTSCQKLAWGVGVESERVIRASMVSKDGKSFDLTIRSFDESSMGGLLSAMSVRRNVVVISMYPKGDWERRMSYQLQKVTNVPVMLCDSKVPVF